MRHFYSCRRLQQLFQERRANRSYFLLEAFLDCSGHRTVIASNRLTSPERDTSILLNLASISIVDCRVMRRLRG